MNKIIYNTFEKLFWGYFIWTAMSISPIALSRDKLIYTLDNVLNGFIMISCVIFEKSLLLFIYAWDYIYINLLANLISNLEKII